MKPIVGWINLFAALCAIACNRASAPQFGGDEEAVQTIAYLKSRCTSQQVTIRQDLTIRGVVTANDLYGEFYKTLVVEDASGGISIAVDLASTAPDYPIGTTLLIRCNGLTLTEYGGKIELGTPPTEYGAGRIPSAEITRYVHIESIGKPLTPPRLTIDQIAFRHVDTYVLIEEIAFTQAGFAWCDLDPTTSKPITTDREAIDRNGNRIQVRTAATCTYAKEPTPEGIGSLYGVIDYFNGNYSLRIVHRGFEFSTATLPTTYP